ncbi:hypothetical protein L9G16_23315, partial [Shewanella sp. A25]|nr:hypothetical protein [Shewanella shenzhenensis]
GASTATRCTLLLTESHRQIIFQGISTNSSYCDASSHTGDTPHLYFSRKPHSTLMEDMVT